jgi:NAD(P)-dependent dehydrogenase (short-subunit alcohol dehydrogenase family)
LSDPVVTQPRSDVVEQDAQQLRELRLLPGRQRVHRLGLAIEDPIHGRLDHRGSGLGGFDLEPSAPVRFRGGGPPPADIAGTVVFLASPAARHVTGQVLNVNGGAYQTR